MSCTGQDTTFASAFTAARTPAADARLRRCFLVSPCSGGTGSGSGGGCCGGTGTGSGGVFCGGSGAGTSTLSAAIGGLSGTPEFAIDAGAASGRLAAAMAPCSTSGSSHQISDLEDELAVQRAVVYAASVCTCAHRSCIHYCSLYSELIL